MFLKKKNICDPLSFFLRMDKKQLEPKMLGIIFPVSDLFSNDLLSSFFFSFDRKG